MKFSIDDYLIEGLTKDFPMKSLYEMVVEQVKCRPNSIAIEFKDIKLTYGELSNSIDRISNELLSNTHQEELMVGVLLEPCVELVPIILAILKVGCTCVPLPADYPKERLKYIIDDCNLRIVFHNSLENINDLAVSNCIDVTKNCYFLNAPCNTNSSYINNNNPIAFVMYTSGSTGNPKGVLLSSKGIINRLFWMRDFYDFSEKDVVFHKSSIGFDVALWEIFLPLFFGGRVIIISPGKQKILKYYLEAIPSYGITFIQLVPGMLKMLLTHPKVNSCHSLRVIVCGGEKWGIDLGKQCLEKLPTVMLCNGYGPTEASLGVSGWRLTKNWDKTFIPIGTPVHNVDFVVLDENKKPVPVGKNGELYIGGVAVSPGYLNNPELTDEKFTRLLSKKHGSSKFYKTGDIVKRLSDSIVYIGRKDNQVQINGFRIELEEIENIIGRFKGVKEVIALCKEIEDNINIIIAFVCSDNFNKENLLTHCRKNMPTPMIPSSFIPIAKMPLNVNGKIDRGALSKILETTIQTLNK